MKASIIIAAHNEGELLFNTVRECVPLCDQNNFEIIVADDCSTDDSIEPVVKKYSNIRIVQTDSRKGPSPTKDLGAQAANGDVLIFLDGHCKPEPHSIEKLISNTFDSHGESIFVPRIARLNEAGWENGLRSTGDGYGFNMQTMDTHWVPRDQMEMVGPYYESPALIGCCFAVSRALYWQLCGFDPHMYEWGIEDIDFGFKAWLLGHSILIDPAITIGHRFSQNFSTYTVSSEHVLANKMRMACKCYSEQSYTEWIDYSKAHTSESVWITAQELYNQHFDSVEREKAYIQSQQVRSEFDYSERFGLDWPQGTFNKSKLCQLNKRKLSMEESHPVFDRSTNHSSNSSYNIVITYDDPDERSFQIRLRIGRDSSGLLIIQDADVHAGKEYDSYHAAYRVVNQLRGYPVHRVRQLGTANPANQQNLEDAIWERIHQTLSKI